MTATKRSPKVLLLGMVFSNETRPKRGQEFRDRVRCEALENCGFDVYTTDNKHASDKARTGKHVSADFCDFRRMLKGMHDFWGPEIQFDYVILDYFFSPIGWARQRWGEKFFKETLPNLVSSGILAPDGKVILPNLECVQESINAFDSVLYFRYQIKYVKNPNENPLYKATDHVTDELLRCPDNLTNETQIKPLYDFSNNPFYVLIAKFAECITPPSSSSSTSSRKQKLQLSNVSSSSEYSNSSSNKKMRIVTPRNEDRSNNDIIHIQGKKLLYE